MSTFRPQDEYGQTPLHVAIINYNAFDLVHSLQANNTVEGSSEMST